MLNLALDLWQPPVYGTSASTLTLADGTVSVMDLQLASGNAFINGTSVSLAAVLACTRSSAGYAETSSGSLVSFLSNTLRRTDRGVLAEAAATNLLRNNTMVGASAGVAPTNWTIPASKNGVNITILGVTTAADGTSRLDLQFSGTATGTGINALAYLESLTQMTAVNGNTHTSSAYVELVAGDFTNVNTLALRERYNNSGGSQVGSSADTSIKTATATRARFSATNTATDATTAYVVPLIVSTWVVGPVNFTLGITLPQTETGSYASSPIATSGASATRSADVLSMTGASLTDWFPTTTGTVAIKGRWRGTGASTNLLGLSAGGSSTDRFLLNCTSGNVVQWLINATAGSTGSIAGPTLSTEADFTSAMRYATNAMGASYNGGAVTTDTTVTIPTGIDRLYVGAGGSGTAQSRTYVSRLAWFSSSLSDANLQAVQALL